MVRRAAGEEEVCLVLRGRHNRKAWGLPKGHLESGEDAATAALREVREETGWTGEILQPLRTITYQFTKPGERTVVSKTVSFFLMRALTDAGVSPDTQEVLDVRWMPWEEALRCVAYDNERQVLLRAKGYLEHT